MSNLKYIDCHSHPHDKKFLESGVDVDMMMKELGEDGGATIAIGTDYTETEKAISFAKKYPNCWATIGIHPADNHTEIFSEEKFESFLKLGEGKVVGVGECGLDYYYFTKLSEDEIVVQKARQKELFRKQIEFAIKHDLPLVLHGRPSRNSMDAYRDMLDILEEYANCEGCMNTIPGYNKPEDRKYLTGHAHFFVGNLEIAKRFLELGFLMSFDGPITFTNEYDNVIKFLPMENIMIETDAPYAAPGAYRGQLNYPKYVKEVAKKIAELKNISVDEVFEITKNNAIKLFKIKV
jgi:TatD DNase family protein